jgi:hypothetical protein
MKEFKEVADDLRQRMSYMGGVQLAELAKNILPPDEFAIYAGDNLFATGPYDMVGLTVHVPAPDRADDAWTYAFIGKVKCVRSSAMNLVTVVDQDDNGFDIEWYRLSPQI